MGLRVEKPVGSAGSLLVLSLLIVVSGLGIYRWHQIDTLPPHQDEARHLRASLHYLDDLRRPFKERISLISFRRFETYPPLVYIVTIPFYLAGGTDKDVAGLVNIAFMAVIILSVYGIGRRLYTETVGLTATVITSCYPIIVGLSRLYVLEIPETAMVCLAIYAAIRTEGFRRTSWSFSLGIIFGLGMLVKWHFFIFCAAPVLYIFLSPGAKLLLYSPLRRRLCNLGCCAGAVAVLAVPWYAHNFSGAAVFVARNLTREFWGTAPPVFSVNGFLFYPYALADTMLLAPMTVIFIAGLAIIICRRKVSPLLILWFLVPLIIVTLVKQKIPRYFTPALPAAALITAAGLSLIKRSVLRRAVIGMAFAIGALNFIALTFQFPRGKIDISCPLPFLDPEYNSWFNFRASIVKTELPSYGMGPPRRENWGMEKILDDVTSSGYWTEEQKATLGWFIFPHMRFHRYALFYYIDLNAYPIRCVPPDRARFILTRLTTEEQAQKFSEWLHPWLHLERLKSYRLPDSSEVVLYRARLTRRRHYRAYELPRDVGEEKVEDDGALSGWARFADRDESPPGIIVKIPPHPLDKGYYHLAIRLKYNRLREKGHPARIELTAKTSGKSLLSNEISADEAGEAGYFNTIGFNFKMPERDRLKLKVFHEAAADLWIDQLEIIPIDNP